eukprot:6187481-Pleurochrysis_carterae.AAC.1
MPLPSITVSTLPTLYILPRPSSQRSISQSRRCRGSGSSTHQIHDRRRRVIRSVEFHSTV